MQCISFITTKAQYKKYIPVLNEKLRHIFLRSIVVILLNTLICTMTIAER